jgi:hypothetical protein
LELKARWTWRRGQRSLEADARRLPGPPIDEDFDESYTTGSTGRRSFPFERLRSIDAVPNVTSPL